jgi:hypothetical protein
MRIAGDLERVGDLAKNIAKRVIAIGDRQAPAHLATGIGTASERVGQQLAAILKAYAARDDAAALSVWRADGEIDTLFTSLFRELLTYMMEDPRSIGFCTHLLFCAKNLERAGDHATNIAETAHYVITGEAPLVQLLRYNFEAAGYAVETIMHGDEAETRLRESVPVKPFSVSELLARANSLLRRAEPTLLAEVITVGDIELDRGAMIVRRRGRVVHLGPTDYRLPEFLMRSPGRVFSREQLLNNVWRHDVYIDDRTSMPTSAACGRRFCMPGAPILPAPSGTPATAWRQTPTV